VSAIANQTGILKGCINDVKGGVLQGGNNITCSYALKWVAHFLGDIAQPLHASGRAAGGNFYRVKFANVSTELHAVSILHQLRQVASDNIGLGRIYPLLCCQSRQAFLELLDRSVLCRFSCTNSKRWIPRGTIHVGIL
jgi:hypothetical protein